MSKTDYIQRFYFKKAIRDVKSTQLYVAPDGPSNIFSEDKERFNKTRNIIEILDRDCEVKILFWEENLGWRLAVSKAIDWFSEAETEGLIKVDDALPNRNYFGFCQRWTDMGGKVHIYALDYITHVGEHQYCGRFFDLLDSPKRVDVSEKIK